VSHSRIDDSRIKIKQCLHVLWLFEPLVTQSAYHIYEFLVLQ